MDKSKFSAIIALGSRAGTVVAQASKGVLAAGCRFIAIDTDENCLVDLPGRVSPLLIGKESFAGAGSAGRADAVREAALLAGPKIDRMLEEVGHVIVCAYLGGGTADGLLPIIGLQLKENSVPALFILFHPPAADITAAGRARAAVQELRRSQANLVIVEELEPAGVATAADLVGILALRLRQPAALRPDGEVVDTMLQNAARARVRIAGGAGIDGLPAMVESLPVEALPPYEILLAVAVGGAGIPAGTLLTARETLVDQGWPSSQILFEAAIAESWNDDLLLVEMICRPFVHESREQASAIKEPVAPIAPPLEQPELFSFVEAPQPEPPVPSQAPQVIQPELFSLEPEPQAVATTAEEDAAPKSLASSTLSQTQKENQPESPAAEPDPVPQAAATPEEEDAAPEPWEDEDVETGLPETEEAEVSLPPPAAATPPMESEPLPLAFASQVLPVESPAPPPEEPTMATPVLSSVPEPVRSPMLTIPPEEPVLPTAAAVPETLPPSLPSPILGPLVAAAVAGPGPGVIPASKTEIEGNAAAQGEFTLRELKRGIFEKAPPTTWNGENLDVPTYLRRGLHLQGDQPTPQE
jgi:hypothetical protein